MEMEQAMKVEMKRYANWINKFAVLKIVRGFLPSFMDGDSRKILVVVDADLSPRTDGETVWISLIPSLLSSDLTEADWGILMRAITAHEVQHINSSNFDDIENLGKWYGKHLNEEFSLPASVGRNLSQNVLNIVEDGRIERIAVARRPGMRVPFLWLNQFIHDGAKIEKKAEDAKGELQDFLKILLSYAKTGSYPEGSEVYAGTDCESNFLAVREEIDKAIAANDSYTCAGLVKDILQALAPYLAALLKQMPNPEEAAGCQDYQAEYTSNKGEAFEDEGNGSNTGNDSSTTSNDSSSGKTGDEQDNDTGSSKNPLRGTPPKEGGGFTSSNESGNSTPPLTSEEINAAREAMRSVMDTVQKEKPGADTGNESNEELDEKSVEKINSAYYTGRTSEFKQCTPNISPHCPLPADLMAQAKLLRREILKLFDERRMRRGRRSGTLDTGALWKTGVGDDAIFSKKGRKDAGSCAFYLLIDNSGSMDGRKSDAARCAAAVIERAAAKLIPCKIALFHTKDAATHTILRSFNDKSEQARAWDSIISISPGGCNSDSIHIRVATEELMRRREKRKILFVLSDGLPSAYSNHDDAATEVRNAVREARRKGITVIPIMFSESCDIENMMPDYVEMYERQIVACGPDKITGCLCDLFKKTLQ